MKQALLLFCFLLFTGKIYCQPPGYTLPQPEKWGKEKIPFPIEFAPSIPFKGMEEIRFTPGWGDNKSEDYWSYSFVWFVEGAPVINQDSLKKYLTQYYTGLYFTNQKESPTGNRDFTQIQVTKTEASNADIDTYEVKISTINFLNKQTLVLNGRIHVRRYAAINRTALLIEISPQDYKHPVWVGMDGIVGGFKVGD
ncbi:hypothetical protein [Mucilaginibacter sp.]|uniref:hypothetical protein n=1 Tax=Mucilaginibacter sp. TaxID=1882438 RepID=UPI0025DC0722|nr:hypothetical protein [Mucilaginibacter sp.]